MHTTDGPGTPIDVLLADALILTAEHACYEAPTAAERIARANARKSTGSGSLTALCPESYAAGRVRVLGLNPVTDLARLRTLIGSQLQSAALPDRMKRSRAAPSGLDDPGSARASRRR